MYVVASSNFRNPFNVWKTALKTQVITYFPVIKLIELVQTDLSVYPVIAPRACKVSRDFVTDNTVGGSTKSKYIKLEIPIDFN